MFDHAFIWEVRVRRTVRKMEFNTTAAGQLKDCMSAVILHLKLNCEPHGCESTLRHLEQFQIEKNLTDKMYNKYSHNNANTSNFETETSALPEKQSKTKISRRSKGPNIGTSTWNYETKNHCTHEPTQEKNMRMQFSPTNKQEQKQKKMATQNPHKSDKKRGPRRKTKSGENENKKLKEDTENFGRSTSNE